MAKGRKSPDTIERVVMGPTGGLCVGIRLRFMDKYHAEPLANLKGYTLFLEPHDCDAWAVSTGDGPWMVVGNEHFDKIEDLGPL